MRALLTPAEITKLLENGACSISDEAIDPQPIAHLIMPGTSAQWLITEIDPDDEDRGFGIVDLGMGFVEMGSFRFSEIEALQTSQGLTPVRNTDFVPCAPLSAYAEAGRLAQRMIIDPAVIQAAAPRT